MTTPCPPIRPLPRFAHWAFERGLKPVDLAPLLKVSAVQVRYYLRAFDDPKRQLPGDEVLKRIVALTGGEVTVADFYPPELSGRPADPAVLAAARAD